MNKELIQRIYKKHNYNLVKTEQDLANLGYNLNNPTNKLIILDAVTDAHNPILIK